VNRKRLIRPRNGGELMGCVNAHRLEGSRFGAYRIASRYSFERFIRPKNVATGGSRELPSAMHSPMASIRLFFGRRAANRWDVPGSRLFSDVSAGPMMRRKLRGAAGYMPKRLPSRRWSAYTGRLKYRRRGRDRLYRCPKYSSCINWSSLRFSMGPSAAISPCCSK
jgi:hypothetical protein